MNILKNRIIARDYMQQIPEEKVYLDAYVRMPMEFYHNPKHTEFELRIEESYKQVEHINTYGLDALQCGTVACVAGWLWTMPEYQDYKKEKGHEGTNDRNINLLLLSDFLGIDGCADTFRTRSGSSISNSPLSDKEIAMQRLNELVHEMGGV